MLDECIEVLLGEPDAPFFLAAPEIDVVERAVLHEGSHLIGGDVEIGRRLIERQ